VTVRVTFPGKVPPLPFDGSLGTETGSKPSRKIASPAGQSEGGNLTVVDASTDPAGRRRTRAAASGECMAAIVSYP